MTAKPTCIQSTEKLERVLLHLLLLLIILIKILHVVYSNRLPDEAYYWLWSNRVALSYFDHPPLLAWVQALLLFQLDTNYFSVSVLPILSLGVVMVIMMAWQKHMFNRFCYDLCLKSMVLFLSFPIYAIFFFDLIPRLPANYIIICEFFLSFSIF